jgi:predicted AAA+ superfamily ATPase
MYVIDNGILDAYSTWQTGDHGAFLENLVFLTLRRQQLEVGYYETKNGHEVDFVYKLNGQTYLIQVAWSLDSEETKEREIRALREGLKELPDATCRIVTLSGEGSSEDARIRIIPLWKFLMESH